MRKTILVTLIVMLTLLIGCSSKTTEMNNNYYLLLTGESNTWKVDSYELSLTPETLKAGDGTLRMKNETEYQTEYFNMEVHAVIDHKDTVIQTKAVTGSHTSIAQINTGAIEGGTFYNKEGKAIELANISDIYMIVEWQDTTVSKRKMTETIHLYGKNKDFINQGTASVNSNITTEDFYQAIKQLKPEAEVSESIIPYLSLQQLKVKNDTEYYIAWTEHMIPSTDLPMLIIFNQNKEPIYLQSFRERIESVKYIGEFVLDKGIIEVTSYGASGSFSGQWIDLLALDDNLIKNIWEYQLISNDSHMSEDKNVMEYFHNYNTYLIVPSNQQRFTKEQKPYIIVNQTSEQILVNEEDKVLSRDRATSQLTYIWDDQQLKFIKKE